MSEYQAFLTQLQSCKDQNERDILSLNFSISRLPEQMRNAVCAAALPRFFDRALLNALLDQPLDEAQFVELTGYSYIEPYPGVGRFNVHERSRKLLQEKLWQEDETRYREISSCALKHCAAQDQDDTTWRIETIYHQLIAEPDKGAIALNNTCLHWLNPPHFAYDKAESLLRAVQEYRELKRLTEKAVHYLLLWQARVDMRYSRNRQAKEALQQIPLASTKENDPYLTANCLQALGDVHLSLSELPHARQRYEDSLPLFRAIGEPVGEANCLRSLGDVHLRLSELPNARQRYEESLLLYHDIGARVGEANCLKALGEMHLRLAELPDAKRHFIEALQLYRDTKEPVGEADSLRMFGNLAVQSGDFIAAQKHYEQASALFERIQGYEGIAECLEGFAELHQAQGHFQQAEEYWQKAADMYHQLAMPLRAEYCLEQLSAGKKQG